jgi:hypothetical protein
MLAMIYAIINNMSIFRCQKCGVCENTALSGCSWDRPRGEMLCSKCCDKNWLSKAYTWHGKFPQEKFDPKKHKIVDGFVEMKNIKCVTANNEEVKLVSNCCGAQVNTKGIGDFNDKDEASTKYFVCLKCGKPCDQKVIKI